MIAGASTGEPQLTKEVNLPYHIREIEYANAKEEQGDGIDGFAHCRRVA